MKIRHVCAWQRCWVCYAFGRNDNRVKKLGPRIGEVDLYRFDSESSKGTGGQNTYQEALDYINIANGSWFKVCEKTIADVDELAKVLSNDGKSIQLYFLRVKCFHDNEMHLSPMKTVKDSVAVFGD